MTKINLLPCLYNKSSLLFELCHTETCSFIFFSAIKPFFALMLVNGNVELHINPVDGASTRKTVMKSSTGTYSDGQEHSVILLRNKRYLPLLL